VKTARSQLNLSSRNLLLNKNRPRLGAKKLKKLQEKFHTPKSNQAAPLPAHQDHGRQSPAAKEITVNVALKR
jgi:hypothetical protein